jgi:hypothetical protein
MSGSRLHASMTVSEFHNGYWYADQLRGFARELGIAGTSTMRKDELERAVLQFLESGTVTARRPARSHGSSGPRDLDRGLGLGLGLDVTHYTSNRETKDFIEREARRIDPALPKRSGVWYRLNRWRDERAAMGDPITYGDLVGRFIELSKWHGPFERIPHGRFLNFIADYLVTESGATREAALAAWTELKQMDIPKDYASWASARDPSRHHGPQQPVNDQLSHSLRG